MSMNVCRAIGVAIAGILVTSLAAAQSTEVFGTQSENYMSISAAAFSGATFNISGSLGRFGNTNADNRFYAPVQIPTGAVIDFIGLNNLNDGTPGAVVARLWDRSPDGTITALVTVESTAHTDWRWDEAAAPAGLYFISSDGFTRFIEVQIPSSANLQFFGSVSLKWHRQVALYSGGSFDDVPDDHPFVHFIEALKVSGITGGCQAAPPLYCPDAPVTRGQMAVFLAKALGLHWPG